MNWNKNDDDKSNEKNKFILKMIIQEEKKLKDLYIILLYFINI